MDWELTEYLIDLGICVPNEEYPADCDDIDLSEI